MNCTSCKQKEAVVKVGTMVHYGDNGIAHSNSDYSINLCPTCASRAIHILDNDVDLRSHNGFVKTFGLHINIPTEKEVIKDAERLRKNETKHDKRIRNKERKESSGYDVE